MNTRKIKNMACCLLSFSAVIACSEEDLDTTRHSPKPHQTTHPDTTSIVTTPTNTTTEANMFVYDVLSTYYYWNDKVPQLSYEDYDNTYNYFYDLIVEEDYFSTISNDAEMIDYIISGKATTIGCHVTYHKLEEDGNNVYAIVRYVIKDSPAYNAGMKRGDIINVINGNELTTENYTKMWDIAGEYKGARINPDTNETQAIALYITPSIVAEKAATEYTVFDNGIAYLHYYSFLSEYNNELTQIFQYFKDNNAKDLILDLRYNPGGYMNAMDHLCSLIAPQTYVDKGDDLILYKYNNIMSSLEGFGKEESTTKFKQDIKSLNLNRIVIITSDMTYSASEATIIGLEPYMEVTTIGTRTGGKNQSSIQFRPSDFTYTSNNKPVYSKRINDWLLIPIIATFYNSKNETFNTLEGLTPDYEIDEDDFLLRELGSEKEPLIAAGIEYLTTGNVTTGSNLKNAKKRYPLPNKRIIRGSLLTMP